MKLINDDCMNIMPDYPDNYFDLAIVDPPYGLNISKSTPTTIKNYKGKTLQGGKVNVIRSNYTPKDWDNNIPSKEYFEQLFRVSKNQIIWGGNYFLDYLSNTKGIIIWNKLNQLPTYADGEMAWSSFNVPLKICNYLWDGFKQGQTFGVYAKVQGNHNIKEKRIHPTQKPIRLYRWLLENYAEPTDKILDTHLGSGSIAIACHYFGIDEFVGIEIDKEYFDNAKTRIEKETRQIKLL